MVAHRIWAFIKDNEVKNTIICDNYPLADSLAKNTLGNESFAVEITQIPTGIGDIYEEGLFKNKEGTIINIVPTMEEEVVMLKGENKELENALLEMSTLQSIKDMENEQAIMGLTMMIGGM